MRKFLNSKRFRATYWAIVALGLVNEFYLWLR